MRTSSVRFGSKVVMDTGGGGGGVLRQRVRGLWRHVAVFVLMTVLAIGHTWPLFPLRKTHLLGGSWEDPWLNAWHVDWMYQSIQKGHTPFFAADLHWPLGAEMYWHSQAPAKTVLAIVLLPLTGGNVVEASNLILFSTFVLAGLTAWWMIRDVLRRAGHTGNVADVAAVVGACAFDFSRYHFAHAHAHMNLAAIEALPAFVLCMLRFLEAESVKKGWAWLVGAGIAGLYAMGCDLYYAYYLSLFLLAWIVFQLSKDGETPLLRWATLNHVLVRRALMLSIVSAVCCLPIALPLVWHLRPAPWSIHGSSMYPADPIMLVAPDVLSYWTGFFPSGLATALRKLQDGILNDIEGGLFIGLVAIALGVIGGMKERVAARPWVLIGVGFLILSLGPFLNIGGEDALPAQIVVLFVVVGLALSKRVRQSVRGREVLVIGVGLLLFLLAFGMKDDGKPTTIHIPLPYLFFKHVAPFFSRGGMPVRFLLMTQLCLGVLIALGVVHLALGWKRVSSSRRLQAFALAAAFALVNLEAMNKPFEMMAVKPPATVFETIRSDPEAGVAVFTDHVLGQFEQIYHRRPVSFARQSRTPMRELAYVQSPLQKILVGFEKTDAPLTDDEIAEMRSWLRQNGFKYFVGHERAYVESRRWRRASLDAKQRRELFLRDALKAELIYEDEDLQVFRFW
jgi:hypothetical protein